MKFRTLPTGISPATANKIVQVLNVWETGSKEGNYGAYVTYADFTYKGNNYRQITYGKSQTTEFGNLKKLLQMYINNDGTYKDELAPYIDRIGAIDTRKRVIIYATKRLATSHVILHPSPQKSITNNAVFIINNFAGVCKISGGNVIEIEWVVI